MLWVAEVGSAHKGDKSLAYEYIRAYAEAGANVLKFQFGWTEKAQRKYHGEYNPIRYIDEWANDLRHWCNEFDVKLEASIWSNEGLETAKYAGLDIYKIAYRMDDQLLQKEIANAAFPTRVYLSGGNVWCVSKYPAYPEDLWNMPTVLGDTVSVPGYSDHTHGIEACLLAVARGATYIEKHVALDKTDLATKDTPFSATPAEFSEMVRIGNGIRRLLDAQV